MAVDGHLNFDTKIDEKGFSSGVSRLGSVAKTGLGILGTAVGAVTTAMGAGITAGIKYNANIEQYTTSFEVMTGSAEKAAQIMEELQKIGAETPFETETIAETTQLLMNYGFTADEAIEKMRMLGDISQGSADKMNRIAMAYGQMSSAGKVQLEDVKQMIEAGFNPLQEISESTGESMESLYDRISNGTLAVDEITASMQRATSEGGKYYQSMEKQAQTINGLISTLKDNAMQLLGEVVEPISDSMREELLPAAIDAIEGMQKAFKEDGVDGLIEAGTEVMSNFLFGMAEGAPQVIETALQIINSLVNALTENAPQLAISAASVVMAFAQGVIQMLPSLLSLGMQLIVSLIQGLAQQIPQLIPVALKAVLQLVQGITSNLPKIVKAGVDLLAKLIEGIISALPQLIAYAPQIILALLKGIIGAVGQLLTAGPKILVAVGKGIVNALGTIWSYAKQIPGKIKDAILDTNWGSIGRNIISGIANGIVGAAGRIVDAAKSAAKKALNAAKDFLGINSPSKLFRDEVGKYMAQGIGVGFEKYMPTDDMVKDLDRSVSKINASVHPAFPEPAYRGGGNVDQSKQVTVNQTVNINQPVETPAETARAIKKTATYGLAGA